MTRTPGRRLGIILGTALICLVVAGATIWGALALNYSNLENAPIRNLLIGAFCISGLAVVASILLGHRRRPAILGYVAIFALLLGWWSRIEPSNERDWQPEVARLAYAEIDGDIVTVRDIRNFDYRTETDFKPAYYDRTYDLSKLQSVDLVAVYWMGPAIAHTFLSFGFAGGDQLAISIETRKEKGEDYSTAKGFFKQYELYYVVADERDVIRLRTNYRKDPPEDVHIYRLHGPIDNGRRLFLRYMQRINELKARPEFYNTLIDNCTTGIWMNAQINPGHVALSWKILASGYVPEYLYEAGRLAPGVPFDKLQRLGHVNRRAQAADQAVDFPRRIRIGLPGAQADLAPAAEPPVDGRDRPEENAR